MMIGNGRMILGNCLDVMADIPDASIDMVLCDLPYGTTQNKWDAIIPFEPLWAHYWRVAKPNAAIVLTAQPPFDKLLGASQIRYLKYEWIWEKSKATGHLNAKKQPMKAHENVLVFYREQCPYFPQKTAGKPYVGKGGKSPNSNSNYGNFEATREGSEDGSRYPRSVVYFSHVAQPLHPTQKPVALFEYLIRTYTNEGDTVLDNCSGSGTTAIAAINSGRRFVCIEQDVEYYYASLNQVREVAA